jgi:hypothetical protein
MFGVFSDPSLPSWMATSRGEFLIAAYLLFVWLEKHASVTEDMGDQKSRGIWNTLITQQLFSFLLPDPLRRRMLMPSKLATRCSKRTFRMTLKAVSSMKSTFTLFQA